MYIYEFNFMFLVRVYIVIVEKGIGCFNIMKYRTTQLNLKSVLIICYKLHIKHFFAGEIQIK